MDAKQLKELIDVLNAIKKLRPKHKRAGNCFCWRCDRTNNYYDYETGLTSKTIKKLWKARKHKWNIRDEDTGRFVSYTYAGGYRFRKDTRR